jgi:hypothetical protein
MLSTLSCPCFPCILLGVIYLELSPPIHVTVLKVSDAVAVAWRHGPLTVSPILKLCVFIDCLLSFEPATRWVLEHAWPQPVGSFGDYSTCASHGTGERDFTAFWVICSSSSRRPTSQFEISPWASPTLETCLICRPNCKLARCMESPSPWLAGNKPGSHQGPWVA